MRSYSGDSMIIYFSNSTSATIDFAKFKSIGSFMAVWIDLKTGEKHEIGNFKNIKTKTFSIPDGWEDGILLLEANKSTE